jgi:hypothetical protein
MTEKARHVPVPVPVDASVVLWQKQGARKTALSCPAFYRKKKKTDMFAQGVPFLHMITTTSHTPVEYLTKTM